MNNIVKSFLILSSTVCAAGINFLLQVLYAKNLDVKEYGQLVLYLNFILLIMPLVGAGLPNYWIKINAKYDNGLSLWLKPSLYFLKYTILLSVLIQIVFCYIYHDIDITAYWLLATFIIGQTSVDLINSINIIRDNTFKYIFWRLISPTSRIVLLLILVLNDNVNIKLIGVTYFISSIIPTIGLVKYLREFTPLKNNNFTALQVFQNCWMYSISGLLYISYLQGSTVLIGYFHDYKAVAQYNIPIVLLTAILMLPSILFQKVFVSELNKWFYTDPVRLRKFFFKANLIMLFAGIAFAIALYILAPIIIKQLFGYKYIESIPILRILSILIPFAFTLSSLSSIHIKKRDLKNKVWIMLLVFVMQLIIILMMHQYYGVELFAYTTVLSYFFICIFLSFSAKNIIKRAVVK